jgi:hypothetical protein
VSPEQDMRDLGLTIAEVMTRERQASAVPDLPQPFRDIVEHTLAADAGSQWTARQAALRLSGKLAEPVGAPPPTEAKPDEPAAVASGAAGMRLSPIWILGAAAAAMLLIMIFVLTRSSSSSAASPEQKSEVAPPPAPSAGPIAVPGQGVAPGVVPKPAPKPSAVAPPPRRQSPFDSKTTPAPAAAQEVKGRGWFVVVASYAREGDAAMEARELARRFSQFRPSVFPPSAIDTHYLVIIGSGLGQDGAENLRLRAVASGMPADTYIKKYPDGRK